MTSAIRVLPRTYCADGDPLDALVLGQEPVAPLSILRAKAIGVITMRDEARDDDKIVAVHVDDPEYAAALSRRWPKDVVVAALGRLTLVCRGPKPVAALKEVGLVPALTVPEPNTWRDLLSSLDDQSSIAGKRVAVQEYGARNEELLAGLRHRGARVAMVPVYGWAMPEDTAPLRAAIERIVASEVEVALFTSATQVDHVFRAARDMGRADALRKALRARTVVASIGPITTEALHAHEVEPDLHPAHPKMGHLVAEVARHAADVLRRKRRE